MPNVDSTLTITSDIYYGVEQFSVSDVKIYSWINNIKEDEIESIETELSNGSLGPEIVILEYKISYDIRDFSYNLDFLKQKIFKKTDTLVPQGANYFKFTINFKNSYESSRDIYFVDRMFCDENFSNTQYFELIDYSYSLPNLRNPSN